MNSTTSERQKLLETVNNLPDEALCELAGFLDYLRYKTQQPKENNNNTTSFLLTVSGLGNSGEQNISERDEEILRNEIDSMHGWNIKQSNRT